MLQYAAILIRSISEKQEGVYIAEEKRLIKLPVLSWLRANIRECISCLVGCGKQTVTNLILGGTANLK